MTGVQTCALPILAKQDIPTAVHYPLPINRQPLFLNGDMPVHFPRSDVAAKQVLSLPFHPYMQAHEMEKIVDRLINIVAESRAHGSPTFSGVHSESAVAGFRIVEG